MLSVRASIKLSHTVGLHSYDILKKGETIVTENKSGVRDGRGCDYKGIV